MNEVNEGKKNPDDLEALYREAWRLDMGEDGYVVDKDRAVQLYKQAAERGHISAQNNLGAMYEAGEGVPVDYEQAAYWYEKSSEQGNPNAMVNLGELSLNGKGRPVDYVCARELFEQAAAKGSYLAYQYLAKIYDEGLGTEVNHPKALACLAACIDCRIKASKES